MKVLLETIGFLILKLEKYLFSELSKRKVIEDGAGGKSLLRKKNYDFAGQVAAIYDRVNNVLAHHEIIDLVQELNTSLDHPAASRQVSRHIIPKSKEAGYIKVFLRPQSTTIYRSDITVEQQFWWHTLVEK